MTASWGDPTQPLPQPETRRRRLPETVPTTVLMPPAPPRMPVAPPPPLYYPPLAPPDQPPLPPAPGLPHPRRGGRWFRRGLLLATVALVIVLLLFVHRASDFGTAISTQAPFTTQLGRNGRVNLVFLGYGGAGHDGPYLTDSLLVVSYDPASGKSALISVPRDLWVQVPANSGQYAKLNTAYAYGVYHGGPNVGGALAALKVTEILGMNVPYWLSLDFTGFEQLVDKLGGVDINVPDDFVASMSPSHSPSWVFHHGEQHMNGTLALIFARARYNEPAAEASDFARSVHQQLLMKAIADKLRSPLEWRAIPGVMDALQPQIHTNLSLRDLTTIFRETDFAHALHFGLTNQNVLVDATSADGQAILLPANGDWNAIVHYVQTQLNG